MVTRTEAEATPRPPLIFTFKSFLQFVPNMSTRHPRTWSPTSSSCCQNQDHLLLGSRDSSVVQWWNPDQKVTGLRPSWSRNIFFSSNQFFCANSLQSLFYPYVTVVLICETKRLWSSCPKWGWQVIYLNTHQWHAPYICGIKQSDTVDWGMVVWCTQNMHWYGSSFTWHQPCNNYTISVDIQQQAV